MIAVVLFFSAGVLGAADVPTNSTLASTTSPPVPVILTPKPAATPRINGPVIFGVRPGSPFLYTMPVTGSRPMKFSADNMPRGLKLDSKTGHITGSLEKSGEIDVVLHAKNSLVGETRHGWSDGYV